jgi:DNA-binding MarR family transcriptional regulator
MADEVGGPPVGARQGPISSAIFRVARSHKMLAGVLLAEVGLYPGQELVLMILADAGPLEQRELVRQLGTHASTITKMVQRLARAGFVRRSRSNRDARGMVVELTEHGSAMAEQLHDIWQRLEELSIAELSPTQRKNLLPTMARLERSINNALRDHHRGGADNPPGSATDFGCGALDGDC